MKLSTCHSHFGKRSVGWYWGCKHGRQGQPQHGVDVYGRRGGKGDTMLYNVKGKTKTIIQSWRWKSCGLRLKRQKALFQNWDIYRHNGCEWWPDSGGSSKVKWRKRKAGLFSVSVRGWDDIQNDLYDFPEVIEKHYPQYGTSIRKTAEP